MSEQWSKITGYDGYLISSYGNVAYNDGTTKKPLKPYPKDNGYLNVDLYTNGQRTGKRVHILVAEAFVNGKKDGYTVDHKDRNRHNNKASNLEWKSVSDQNRNRKSLAKGGE